MPTTASTGTAQLATDTTAFDRALRFALRAPLTFQRVADVMPVSVTHRAVTIQFNFMNDLAVADTPLTELADVSPVALSDTTSTVSLAEYGNVTSLSAKIKGTAYLNEIRRAIDVMGYNGGLTFDTLARTALLGGTNVIFPSAYGGTGTTQATIAVGDTLKAAGVRIAFVQLVNANVMPFDDGLYRAFIAPDQSYDLRIETAAGNWREPHVNAGDPTADDPIWNGSIGAFEGFDFIVTPRLSIASLPAAYVDAGAGNVDVYPAVFVGRESMVKAFADNIEDSQNGPEPVPVMSPQTDNLRRFSGIGWYWLGGFARFREAAIRRVETSSSIGANV